jgi:delta1-piperideine-2-carboxylate reductase
VATVSISLEELGELATRVFSNYGCDEANTRALVRTVVTAERDGSLSHGLFRVPGYIASLRSGKVNGKASPKVSFRTSAIVSVHGDNGYAPLAIERGVPVLAEAAKELGVAVMALTHSHHFAALWPEVEAIAAEGLIGMACVCYMPFVAPHGGNQPIFGTNPIAFAWPRPGKTPMVIDMATAAMAQGEVQIAARDGYKVRLGTGLDHKGQLTTDPNEILKGMLLPFGGHKGSAIALMVELLAAGAVGERVSRPRRPTTKTVGRRGAGSSCWRSRRSSWPGPVGRSIVRASSAASRPSRARDCLARAGKRTARPMRPDKSTQTSWRAFAHFATNRGLYSFDCRS